jgi:hypothetical protein
MPRTYESPAGHTVGPCRVCGVVRTLKHDGRLRVHKNRDDPTATCPGAGLPPRGAGDHRPVWLLDVDGVLNADKPGWGAAPRRVQVFSHHVSREFTIRFAPDLIERVRRINRDGLVEIRWCTTWCGDTDGLEKVFVLPAFGASWTDYYDGDAARQAKLAAARAVLADGRRLVWTDDSEVPEDGDVHDELTKAGNALLIRPDARYGLQPADLDAIEAFVAA